MKATATRTSGYMYRLDIRQHQLIADEPRDQGGEDQGPTPQELLAASLAWWILRRRVARMARAAA